MAEYVVTVKKDANWQELKTELTTDTSADASVDSAVIPDREVTVTALRSTNTRNTEYDLTDDEAIALCNDDRVMAVEKISTKLAPVSSLSQDGQDASSFNKNDSATGNQDNWGLLRHISTTNNFGTSKNDPGGTYDYVLDGTGVDVVIMDTGIQADHPEWEDADGNTRLQQIDWSTTSSTSYTQHGNTYTDISGHGTHVASTVAGKTFGWAKNARIYSIPINGGNGADLNSPTAFDVVRDWHNAKSGADAGRPTVVNMSFGDIILVDRNFTPNRITAFNDGSYWTYSGGSYRGASHTLKNMDGLTTRGINYNPLALTHYQPRIDIPTNADVEQMVNAGIHVVVASGNEYMKIDTNGGDDFNNYLDFSYTGNGFNGNHKNYYNRGGSPSGYEINSLDINGVTPPTWDTHPVIHVGAIDSTSKSATLDKKVNFSNSGPGVDLYAAGTDIIGAYINTGGSTYSKNSSYKQARMSGTSMAAPQATGIVACLLQAHPDWNPATVKKWIIDNAQDKIHSTGANNDYTTTDSLHGGTQKVAYFPMNGSRPFTWSSS